MSLDLLVAAAIFVASVAVVIGLSLFVLTVILKMQHKHRKRWRGSAAGACPGGSTWRRRA